MFVMQHGPLTAARQMLGAEGAFEGTIRINTRIITGSSGSGILMDSAVHVNDSRPHATCNRMRGLTLAMSLRREM
jgi:hypothetical protein